MGIKLQLQMATDCLEDIAIIDGLPASMMRKWAREALADMKWAAGVDDTPAQLTRSSQGRAVDMASSLLYTTSRTAGRK